MAKDPAFLFYPNDWLGGTMGMSFEEKGAYMEILMMQFSRGHMSEDMIVRMIGHIWDNIKVKFKQDNNNQWYNERLEIEQIKRKSFVKSRHNNKEGKNQFSKNGHMSNHMGNGNEDSIIHGVEIFKENSLVRLSDGTFQPLGASQKVRVLHDDIRPDEILKGQIL